MERRFACTTEELENGSTMTLEFDEPIALYRTEDGELFATQDSCSHEQWSLGEDSEVEGSEVVCPLHMARFDLKTGKALCFPATVALTTYAVEVDEDGKVYVLA
ncbi:MAG: ferredoxin [Frankiales bacterium]|nr:ferredoxin [Frankiales bacterium]